jgi:cell division protease FtsH
MRFDEVFEKLEGNNVSSDEPTDLIERIKFRRAKLYRAGEELKTHFVDLDHIIDEVIHNIENWYVMPELNTRPVIVCLWGMTGVGKTDLVRKLTKAIGFGDRFLEIQMSSDSSSAYSSSIKEKLNSSNISRGEPGVILLDEIQRWRTVADNGMDAKNTRYQDLWMLLSDGKFNSRINRDEIFSLAYGGSLYWVPEEYDARDLSEMEPEDEDAPPQEGTKKKGKKKRKSSYNRSYTDAARIKNLLRLEEPVIDIMRWSKEEKQVAALSRINDPDIYDGDDYSNVLIFISGNLDEAYSMANSVDDTDVDADVLHAFSKKINFLTIKRALRRRFKPEQIARFGNTHVIYPSMSKSGFERLIDRKLNELANRIHEGHGIRVTFNNSLNKFIYRNGVIPSQGVRPVFSTLGAYVENAMPQILLEAIERGIDEVLVHYADKEIFSVVGGKRIAVEAVGRVDQIKKKNNKNSRALVSVHEAGHALMYALKFGVAPTQIISNTSSVFKDGYIGCHEIRHTEESVRKMITVGMAGRAAEMIVFGESDVSAGAQADITSATSLAASYYREWGFGKNKTLLRHQTKNGSEYANNEDGGNIDSAIEKLVSDSLLHAENVIIDHLPMYKELVAHLVEHGKIETEEFIDLFAKYDIAIRKVDPKVSLYGNFNDALQRFME